MDHYGSINGIYHGSKGLPIPESCCQPFYFHVIHADDVSANVVWEDVEAYKALQSFSVSAVLTQDHCNLH